MSTTLEATNLSEVSRFRVSDEVEELRSSVLQMGGLVESQLSNAIRAIVSGDSELGLKVARDDYSYMRPSRRPGPAILPSLLLNR